MIKSTQDHLEIADIKENLVLCKNGDVALVLQTTAVNFSLMSGNEQVAIIAGFAGLLNSLTYTIQILIRSKRLNIASYIELLDQARAKQTNPLLSQMMLRYRNFIERTIRENEVLDKQFYVIVPLWSLEAGYNQNSVDKLKKAKSVLIPRRDHISRQLAGLGLQTKQLTTVELIKLFYDAYNNPDSVRHPVTTQLAQDPNSSPTEPSMSVSEPELVGIEDSPMVAYPQQPISPEPQPPSFEQPQVFAEPPQVPQPTPPQPLSQDPFNQTTAPNPSTSQNTPESILVDQQSLHQVLGIAPPPPKASASAPPPPTQPIPAVGSFQFNSATPPTQPPFPIPTAATLPPLVQPSPPPTSQQIQPAQPPQPTPPPIPQPHLPDPIVIVPPSLEETTPLYTPPSLSTLKTEMTQSSMRAGAPFVVEEVKDEYGNI